MLFKPIKKTKFRYPLIVAWFTRLNSVKKFRISLQLTLLWSICMWRNNFVLAIKMFPGNGRRPRTWNRVFDSDHSYFMSCVIITNIITYVINWIMFPLASILTSTFYVDLLPVLLIFRKDHSDNLIFLPLETPVSITVQYDTRYVFSPHSILSWFINQQQKQRIKILIFLICYHYICL